MALPVRQQIIYWTIAAAVLVALLVFLGDVLLPFVLGGAVAYCLDPVADRLERWGLSRVWATVVITIVALLVFVLAVLLIIPTLLDQLGQLFALAPELGRELRTWIDTRFPDITDANSTIGRSLASLGETIQAKGAEFINGVLTSALSFLNVLVLVVLVPVVAFYLLLDWDRMVAQIDDLLPRDHAPVIRKIAGDIDNTLAAFIRGQGTVCLILGIYYAALLAAVGLQFGLVIGAVAGLISFIPYVGAVVGGALAVGLALFQFWGEWIWVAAVYAIFQSGQFLEGNILTPKLVGSSVGLHPVWLIFALSVFGTLFGFIGLLVAVPLAASIGVIARFFIGQYRQGLLYKGVAGREGPEDNA
ncbi:MAG: AI-2E family transporter [Pseudomonadota bacterium]